MDTDDRFAEGPLQPEDPRSFIAEEHMFMFRGMSLVSEASHVFGSLIDMGGSAPLMHPDTYEILANLLNRLVEITRRFHPSEPLLEAMRKENQEFSDSIMFRDSENP